MNEVINTAGDLRRLMAQTMADIRSGDVSVDKATCIAALAKEINSSLLAECKVAKVRMDILATGKTMGEVTHLGKMLIGDDSVPMLSGK